MRRLLDRLLATRARRDREERFTDEWRAADAEMHEIERAIFRVPVDHADRADVTPMVGDPTPIHGHPLERARTERHGRRRYETEQVG